MPLASQEIEAITFPADDNTSTFFGRGEKECFHCMGCCLVSGLKWWTQYSCWVRKYSRKLAGSATKSAKVACDMTSLVCFEQTSKAMAPTERKPSHMHSSLCRMLSTRSKGDAYSISYMYPINSSMSVIHHHVVNTVNVFFAGGCGRTPGPWVFFKAFPTPLEFSCPLLQSW